MLHAINERVAAVYQTSGKSMPRALRAGIALAALLLSSLVAATFGLVVLVAKGYGTLTYVFIALLVVPLLTVGVWKISSAAARGRTSGPVWLMHRDICALRLPGRARRRNHSRVAYAYAGFPMRFGCGSRCDGS